jgi:hypothetical protein
MPPRSTTKLKFLFFVGASIFWLSVLALGLIKRNWFAVGAAVIFEPYFLIGAYSNRSR